MRQTVIVAKATVKLGRKSDCDICLRLEPIHLPANRDQTLRISSAHLHCRYLGNCVELLDTGSSNGTMLDGRKLAPGESAVVAGTMNASLAGVMSLSFKAVPRRGGPADTNGVFSSAFSNQDTPQWLQAHLIGNEKPGMCDFLHIKRLNNMSEWEYVVLFHAGRIGPGADALIPLTMPTTKSFARVRVFDVGEQSVNDSAQILVKNGHLWLERIGKNEVLWNDRPLAVNSPAILSDKGSIGIGQIVFNVSI